LNNLVLRHLIIDSILHYPFQENGSFLLSVFHGMELLQELDMLKTSLPGWWLSVALFKNDFGLN